MSYRFAPDARKRKTARFITKVRRELQKAYMEEKASRGISQADLARLMGVNRAVVCRQLAGSSNLTLRTIADFAWALNRDLEFRMPKRVAGAGTNHHGDAATVAPVAAANTTALPAPSGQVDELVKQALSAVRANQFATA